MTIAVNARYVIRGGNEGRARLRVLARVMHETTFALLTRLGVGEGLNCLDAGCGGGDVTLELARRVAPGGRVVGVDIDETKLELARREAAELGVDNVEFRAGDVSNGGARPAFDVVYARFLLTHLADPARAVSNFYDSLRPGGLLIVEDIEARGSFSHPESGAYERFVELYRAAARGRGGDPDIGPRLPAMLAGGGFESVGLNVVQPAGTRGEVKSLAPLTLEGIADAVVEDKLAGREEVGALVEELYAFADDTRTVMGVPRVFQVWGRRPRA